MRERGRRVKGRKEKERKGGDACDMVKIRREREGKKEREEREWTKERNGCRRRGKGERGV